MGMESPNESQRIDDVEKARAMAQASDRFHTEAKDLRDKAERYPDRANGQEGYLSQADSQEKGAERAENLEGEIYDIKQENSAMTEREAMREIAVEANNAENKRQEDLKKVKEKLGID